MVEALRPGTATPTAVSGNVLEADLRSARAALPQAVALAFDVLDEAGAFDDPMVAEACDWLAAVATPDGGVPFVLEPALALPARPCGGNPARKELGSMLVTPMLAAAAPQARRRAPRLEGATEMVWRGIGELDFTSPYTARAVFAFLDHVPDRDRAEATMAEIGPRVLESGVVATDPDATGEVHTPLDFAPEPGGLSRAPFDDSLIERHRRHGRGATRRWRVDVQLDELGAPRRARVARVAHRPRAARTARQRTALVSGERGGEPALAGSAAEEHASRVSSPPWTVVAFWPWPPWPSRVGPRRRCFACSARWTRGVGA